MLTARQLIDSFPELISAIKGDESRGFEKVLSAEIAEPNSVVFAPKKNEIDLAVARKAGIVVLPEKIFGDIAPSQGVTFLSSPNVYLAMALTLREFFPNQWIPEGAPRIHASATVSKSAVVGKNVHIGAHTVVHEGVRIGDDCIIRENCVIEPGVRLGERTHLFPFAVVARDCLIGDDCVIQSFTVIGSEGFGYAVDKHGERHHILHKGKVILHDRVEVGAGCTIDRGTFEDTVIGAGTKLDNQIHIAHNAVIGKRGVLTGGYMMAGSTKIGDQFVAGARSGVLGHLKITDNVTLAGGTEVRSDIDNPGAYGGSPAQPLEIYRRNYVTQAKLAEMRQNISRLMKAVFKK